MGKKAQAAERMAAATERLAEIFGEMHARDDRDMSADDIIRASNALKELVHKRDQQLAEVVAYSKRLERDLEQRSLELETLLKENDQLRTENYNHRAGLGGLMPPGDKLVIVP